MSTSPLSIASFNSFLLGYFFNLKLIPDKREALSIYSPAIPAIFPFTFTSYGSFSLITSPAGKSKLNVPTKLTLLSSVIVKSNDIEKATSSIITSASKINGSIEHIRLQYMQKIERKLETYSAKLNKTLKRIEA